ncbi:putative glutamine transport system permease protein [Streptococcus pneumoniae]|nr:putative glutamine transport system permease protein [Streptococcus pneumoniae]
MKLNKLNFLKENIRNLYSSGVIYLGLIISFIPPILVTFFILKTQGTSLGIKHISNFYAMLGMLMAVIHANRIISRDFSHNTINLFYNQQKNRMIYVLSNFLYTISVSIIYALNGTVLLVIVSKLGVPGDLGLDFIVAIVVNTILLVLFYFLLSYIFPNHSYLSQLDVTYKTPDLMSHFLPPHEVSFTFCCSSIVFPR